jgi:hypothetical protein
MDRGCPSFLRALDHQGRHSFGRLVDISRNFASIHNWHYLFIRYGSLLGTLIYLGIRKLTDFLGIIKDPDGGANMDRDSPTFDYAPRVTYMKVSFSIAILYFSLIGTIKISILLMYRRIFAVDSFRQQSLVVGVIVVLWWLSGTIATAVYCVPLEQFWVGPSAGGYCWNYNIFWMVMGAIEVVIDTAILLLPVRMVWPLQLNLQNKIFVIGIFLLGGLYVAPIKLLRILTRGLAW